VIFPRLQEQVMINEYPWEKPYYHAVLETDNEKLAQLILEADEAIHFRLNEITELPAHEFDRIAQTLTALSVLKTERIVRASTRL
jgi:hypothetical protein